MRKLRGTLATLRRRRSNRQSGCGPLDPRRESCDRPQSPAPPTQGCEVHAEGPEPPVTFADILRHRARAKDVAILDPIAAKDYLERARQTETLVAAQRWKAARPVVAVPVPIAQRLGLEVADPLPEGMIPARVPTLRLAVELFQLRWCCGFDLLVGSGDEHECSDDTPGRREVRQQRFRMARELLETAQRMQICLHCARIFHEAECPLVDAFEEFEAFGLPLPDALDPALVAVSELPR